jgi:chorismate mutase
MVASEPQRRWVTRAIRGATTVMHNDREEIVTATAELVAAIMEQNKLSSEEIVSILFTVTPDLNAAFPALGARRLGLTLVPLMDALEIPVPGSLPKCIRCLMHINTDLTQSEINHVYLRGAKVLRPDLAPAEQ